MSIVRFEAPASSIPIMICPILPYPNTDKLKTPFAVTYTYGAFAASVYVQFLPQNQAAAIPPPVSGGEVGYIRFAYYDYYSIYNVNHILTMINEASEQAFGDLESKVTLPANTCPILFNLNSDGTISALVAKEQMISYTSNIKFYMNYELFQFFSGGFMSQNHGITAGNAQYQVSFDQYTYKPVVTRPAPYNVLTLEFRSEIALSSNFVLMTSIVFTTKTMPLVSEEETAIVSNTFQISDNDNSASVQVITDILLPKDSNSGLSWRETTQYLPAFLRWTQLISAKPLSTIDIDISLRDQYSNMYPLILPWGKTSSIKIMFAPKEDKIIKSLTFDDSADKENYEDEM
jgi:hypothetical protein